MQEIRDIWVADKVALLLNVEIVETSVAEQPTMKTQFLIAKTFQALIEVIIYFSVNTTIEQPFRPKENRILNQNALRVAWIAKQTLVTI